MIVTKLLPMIFPMIAFCAHAEQGAPLTELDMEACRPGGVPAQREVPTHVIPDHSSVPVQWPPRRGRGPAWRTMAR
jgi:hypothetical protein